MANPRSWLFMVFSRAAGGLRLELRSGRRSVRRSFTQEEAEDLLFTLAHRLADFDRERAPEAAEQAVLRELNRYRKAQHG